MMGKARRGSPTAHVVGGDVSSSGALSRALQERFHFTRMESLVASSLADGMTYQEIADERKVSYHTVHTHVKAIHKKTGVRSNTRLLALIRKESSK
jgi:DNA-binding CsgD family transcriptional regulator